MNLLNRQPTTILGLGALAATVAGAAAYYFTGGSLPVTAAVVGVTFSLLPIAVNDNTALVSDTEKVAVDIATDVATKSVANAPAVLSDIGAVARDVMGPPCPPHLIPEKSSTPQ